MFYVWMTFLTAIFLVGAERLGHAGSRRHATSTNMSDHVSRALYIATSTFLVGLRRAARHDGHPRPISITMKRCTTSRSSVSCSPSLRSLWRLCLSLLRPRAA